jgi:mRNA-degrading endonuclease RelE of RelBE toxin-antitoxin system
VRALRGELEGLHRYRLGRLRVVYRIVAEERRIRVIAIASRGDIY